MYIFNPGFSYRNCNNTLCTDIHCASYDQSGNIVCPNGCTYLLNGEPVENVDVNKAPCCYQLTVSGVTALSGLCSNCDGFNGSYITTAGYTHTSGFFPGLDGTNVAIYLNLEAWCDGDCCPQGELVTTDYLYGIVGPYSGCPIIDCRNINTTLSHYHNSGVRNICDFSNVSATISGIMNRNGCGFEYEFDDTLDIFPCLDDYGLDVSGINCVTVNESNHTYSYYNECGQLVTVSYEDFHNTRARLAFDQFEISGVTGFDDNLIPTGLYVDFTYKSCTECDEFNKTWYSSDELNICEDCFNPYNSFSFGLTSPSSVVYLRDGLGNLMSSWHTSTPSGACPPSPLVFHNTYQNPILKNRCDFTNSQVTVPFTVERPISRYGCENRNPDTNEVCGACPDGVGPDSFLIQFPAQQASNLPSGCTGLLGVGCWGLTVDTAYIVSRYIRSGGTTLTPFGNVTCDINPCLSGLPYCEPNNCSWYYTGCRVGPYCATCEGSGCCQVVDPSPPLVPCEIIEWIHEDNTIAPGGSGNLDDWPCCIASVQLTIGYSTSPNFASMTVIIHPTLKAGGASLSNHVWTAEIPMIDLEYIDGCGNSSLYSRPICTGVFELYSYSDGSTSCEAIDGKCWYPLCWPSGAPVIVTSL